ncbi:MAG: hypothetical protein RR998_06730 [Oscillospiraceae bacterium]
MKGSGFEHIGLISSSIIFVVVVALALAGISSTASAGERNGLAETEHSIRRAVVECYALEGCYPPDLKYIENNYGIHVNQERYLVHYSANGGNVMPKIIVAERR